MIVCLYTKLDASAPVWLPYTRGRPPRAHRLARHMGAYPDTWALTGCGRSTVDLPGFHIEWRNLNHDRVQVCKVCWDVDP